MKLFIRNFFWTILGKGHHKFLENQKGTYIGDADFVEIDEQTYHNGARVWRWNTNSELKIGKYCSIANNVNFILDSGYHDIFNITSYPIFQNLFSKDEMFKYQDKLYNRTSFDKEFLPKKKSIHVGNDVWIGMGVTILPNVVIGNGVTILAGSVISKSLPDYSIAGGIPGEVLKFKFPEKLHRSMNDIAWWNWTEEKIKQNANDFELNPEEFVDKHLN